jgi:hypothetical protein
MRRGRGRRLTQPRDGLKGRRGYSIGYEALDHTR